jgi:hypothetical protein
MTQNLENLDRRFPLEFYHGIEIRRMYERYSDVVEGRFIHGAYSYFCLLQFRSLVCVLSSNILPYFHADHHIHHFFANWNTTLLI